MFLEQAIFMIFALQFDWCIILFFYVKVKLNSLFFQIDIQIIFLLWKKILPHCQGLSTLS